MVAQDCSRLKRTLNRQPQLKRTRRATSQWPRLKLARPRLPQNPPTQLPVTILQLRRLLKAMPTQQKEQRIVGPQILKQMQPPRVAHQPIMQKEANHQQALLQANLRVPILPQAAQRRAMKRVDNLIQVAQRAVIKRMSQLQMSRILLTSV